MNTTIIIVTEKLKNIDFNCDLDVSFNQKVTHILEPLPQKDGRVFQLRNIC
jgi:hypothetical protein